MEWISVKDELPKDNPDDYYDEYNVYCENNKFHEPIVTTLDWTEHGWFSSKKECFNEFVTHWMTLPEPPNHIDTKQKDKQK